MLVTIVGVGPKMAKLDDGRFVGVSKPLLLSQFERGKQYDVELAVNGKFTNIVKLNGPVLVATKNESLVGQVAAIQNMTPEAKKQFVPAAKPHTAPKKEVDWDKVAMGKVRCAAFAASLQSPVVANLIMTVNGVTDALKVVEQVANHMVSYTFNEHKD